MCATKGYKGKKSAAAPRVFSFFNVRKLSTFVRQMSRADQLLPPAIFSISSSPRQLVLMQNVVGVCLREAKKQSVPVQNCSDIYRISRDFSSW